MDEEEDQGYPWPEDMERRRIAALKNFQRRHPECMLQFKPDEQFHTTIEIGKRKGNEKGYPSSLRTHEKGYPSSGRTHEHSLTTSRRGRRPTRIENKWCLATTLELLEQMKAYVRANKLICLGKCRVKWKEIAMHLTNPCGLELSRLARSSMVRFDNLKRHYREGKLTLIEIQVLESMIDFFKVCERYQTPGSKKSATMDLALRNNALAIVGKNKTGVD